MNSSSVPGLWCPESRLCFLRTKSVCDPLVLSSVMFHVQVLPTNPPLPRSSFSGMLGHPNHAEVNMYSLLSVVLVAVSCFVGHNCSD